MVTRAFGGVEVKVTSKTLGGVVDGAGAARGEGATGGCAATVGCGEAPAHLSCLRMVVLHSLPSASKTYNSPLSCEYLISSPTINRHPCFLFARAVTKSGPPFCRESWIT